ncbi:MAG: recombinase family protein [Gammaproteobacteria bacterium]
MTIRQIAKRLTREGYPTPKGGPHWGETTVHRILRREAYGSGWV